MGERILRQRQIAPAEMIGHLWMNTVFPDGSTARSLVPRLPAEIEAALKELDTAGRRAGGMHAAFGALPSGSAESTRLTILGIILRSCGLPDQYRLAKFCLYLKNNGFYDGEKRSGSCRQGFHEGAGKPDRKSRPAGGFAQG